MFQAIQSTANLTGGVVEIKSKPNSGLDNTTLSPPNGIDVFIRYPNDEEPTWVAWLMKLPDHCVC